MTEETRVRGGCFTWLRRIVLFLVLAIIILLISGAVYQNQAMASDIENYPPPGEMIDVGGFEMHLYCEGEGSPTVVFESGLGDSSLTWWTIRETIVQETRTCVYDRASMGWSDFTNTVPDRNYVVNNLHTLLHNAGEEAPFILVGHSAGGVYVREYAQQFPEDVAGLVFVDSSHENQNLRMPEEIAALDSQPAILRVCQVAAPIGLMRILNVADGIVDDYDGDEDLRNTTLALYNRTYFCTAILNEFTGFMPDVEQDNPPQDLGDLPIFVLTQGIGNSPEDFPDSISLETIEELNSTWLELQAELLALSTNGTQMIVEDAGHYIHHDRPDVVINAIQQILETVRAE